MAERFDSKAAARQHVWDRLQEEKVARFPFPPHGRIPNHAGAEAAARRLFEIDDWQDVRRIKVNPDAPQRPVRHEALRRGITLYMPTPRLKGGFKELDPERIPDDRLKEASALTKADAWAEEVPLESLPAMDRIVCGSVAVTRTGRRAGKGEGYSDLEYALLVELGHAPPPVCTTVHGIQMVAAFPRDPTDLPLAQIATPERIYTVSSPPPAPAGIDWSRLSEADLDAMPVLRGLSRR